MEQGESPESQNIEGNVEIPIQFPLVEMNGENIETNVFSNQTEVENKIIEPTPKKSQPKKTAIYDDFISPSPMPTYVRKNIAETKAESKEDQKEDSEGVPNDQSINDILNEISFLKELSSFPEFSSMITQTYWGPMTQKSTTLDIIAVYLKGQKILYIDSKTYCESKLNFLMMPTIFITAVCTVLSIVLKETTYGAIILASLTGFSTFVLSIISYLKLDAKAQAHKTSAYQFDKLQTMCEFFSGKVLLIKDKDVTANIQKFVSEVEKKVEEIKDTNQFIIPEAIRYRYPIIYSKNVFSEIKKYKVNEKILKSDLFTICRKIDHFNYSETNKLTLEDLHKMKEETLRKILNQRNQTFGIDDQFNKEINEYAERQRRRCCQLCNLWDF